MLTALSEIMGRGSATELSKITDVFMTTIVKDKCEIKDALRDPRARPSPSKQERIRVSVRAVRVR